MTEKTDKDSTTESTAPSEPKNADKTTENASWAHLNQNLKQALNTWDILSEQVADKVSPEEVQLKEVKKLLGELKTKLKEFSED